MVDYATASPDYLVIAAFINTMGSCLHDYGLELRLEDAETGRVLARLSAERDEAGRLLGVEQTRFLTRLRGLRLDANHRYRVVGVYDNPTGGLVPAGAMAYVGGPFIPDDPSDWPEIDTSDPIYQADLARISGEGSGGHH